MTSLMDIHRQELERWKRSMNLVGPGETEEHYVDCGHALEPLKEPRGRWADLGSGAGFPGIIFAAQHGGEECTVELVDVRRKRCVFLQHVLASAGVGSPPVAVRNVPVEDLPAAAYDGILARAFAPPPEVLDHAARLLRPGGHVVLFLQGDAAVPLDPRFAVVTVHPYSVSGRARKSVVLELRVGAVPTG